MMLRARASNLSSLRASAKVAHSLNRATPWSTLPRL